MFKRIAILPLMLFTLSVLAAPAISSDMRPTMDQVKIELDGTKNLSRKDLSNMNLFGLDLSGADLSKANLSGANLSGVEPLRGEPRQRLHEPRHS